MFCKSCGTKIEDGMLFCPECGTPAPQQMNSVQEEQVKVAEEPITQPLTQSDDEITVAPMQMAMPEQTVAPMQTTMPEQTVAPMQATMPEQTVAPMQTTMPEQTVAPMQMTAPVQTTTSSQNFGQTYNTQVQGAGGYNPYGQSIGQQQPIEYVRDKQGKGPVNKKKLFILGGVGIVAVALIILGIIFLPGIIRRNFSSPEDYLAYVIEKTSNEAIDNAANAYANAIDNADVFNTSVTFEAGFQFGDRLIDIAKKQTGMSNIPLIDKAFAIRGNYNAKNYMMSLTGALLIDSKEVLSANAIWDAKDEALYFSQPQLYDKSAKIKLNDLLEVLQHYGGYSYDYNYYYGDYYAIEMLKKAFVSEDTIDEFEETLKNYPDRSRLVPIMKKYSKIISSKIDKVEKSRENLKVSNVSATYTALSFEVDEELVQDMLEAVMKEMVDDEELKEIIIDYAEAIGEDGKKTYKEFKSELKESLDQIDNISKYNSFEFDITLWVDDSDDIRGYRVDLGKKGEFGFAMPKSGNSVGVEYYYQNKYTDIDLVGEGTESFGKLNADMTLYVDAKDYLMIKVSDYNVNDIKKGHINGTFDIRMTENLSDELSRTVFRYSSIGLDFEDYVLSLGFESSDSSFKVNVGLKDDDGEYFNGYLSCWREGGKDIVKPDDKSTERLIDRDDIQDFFDGVDQDDVEKYLKDIGFTDEEVETFMRGFDRGSALGASDMGDIVVDYDENWDF
ncbi:MAG: zinc-ribbon domain-containing protein [Lachnospiraceae bacterium]|nr:zinc-ribbon domain-containing protein [Candidatus Merdinaster equi]